MQFFTCMSDWIHCNRCFVLLKDAKSSGLAFYLTNCGHILCAKCRSTLSTEHCPVCQASCNTVELNARIGPDIQLFFSDPAQLLRKNHKSELQVVEFQSQHIKRLLASLQQERAQFGEERWKLQEENRRLSHELGLFKAENNQLRSQRRVSDTPIFPHTPPTKQSASTTPRETPRNHTPTQVFYTPLARSPSPMGTSPVGGQIHTPPGPKRYSLKGPSPSPPGTGRRISFPSSSQRPTPMLTPGISSLLQFSAHSSQQTETRTPPSLRNPMHLPRSAGRWSQQEYGQGVKLRNPLQITPNRGVTSRLNTYINHSE